MQLQLKTTITRGSRVHCTAMRHLDMDLISEFIPDYLDFRGNSKCNILMEDEFQSFLKGPSHIMTKTTNQKPQKYNLAYMYLLLGDRFKGGAERGDCSLIFMKVYVYILCGKDR